MPSIIPHECIHLSRGSCTKRIEVSADKIWLNPCVLEEPAVDTCPDFTPRRASRCIHHGEGGRCNLHGQDIDGVHITASCRPLFGLPCTDFSLAK